MDEDSDDDDGGHDGSGHMKTVSATAYEKASKPVRKNLEDVLAFLDRYDINSTYACFYHEDNTNEVVMSVDYDSGFLISVSFFVVVVGYMVLFSGVILGKYVYLKLRRGMHFEDNKQSFLENDASVFGENNLFALSLAYSYKKKLPLNYGTFGVRKKKANTHPGSENKKKKPPVLQRARSLTQFISKLKKQREATKKDLLESLKL